MTTKVEICNMALGLVGAETITTIDDNTRVAKSCKTFYTSTLNNLLRSHNWNFAMKRATLTSSGTPAFEYAYKIQKPTDCMRIVSFFNYNSDHTYKEEGNYILINQSSVQAKYIRNDVTETEFDPSFVVALASKLAEVICFQITQNASLTQILAQRHTADIATARRNNAISNTPDDFQDPAWLSVRL